MFEHALLADVSGPSTVSAGARRAALLTRRLDPADRAWLLGCLPAHQRVQLETLLVELAELGIPNDADVLQQVLNEARTHALPSDDHQFLRHLSGAQIGVLASCLRAEPATLTRRLLQVEDWPWREQLMAAWDAAWRGQVDAAADACAPRLQQALVRGIARRVRMMSEQAAVPSPNVPAGPGPTLPGASVLGRIVRPIAMRFARP